MLLVCLHPSTRSPAFSKAVLFPQIIFFPKCLVGACLTCLSQGCRRHSVCRTSCLSHRLHTSVPVLQCNHTAKHLTFKCYLRVCSCNCKNNFFPTCFSVIFTCLICMSLQFFNARLFLQLVSPWQPQVPSPFR
jgi:hypothetical protein